MVKNSLGNTGKFLGYLKPRNLLILLIILCFIIFILVLNFIILPIHKNKAESTNFIQEIIDLPTDIFVKCRMDSNLIAVKSDCKIIYSFNIETRKLSELYSVNKMENYIKTVVSNSEWIIWVENETLIENGDNKAFNWQIVARNTKTGEEQIIDKSNYVSNKYKVPLFINYTPNQIAISNDNAVVYCKTLEEKSNITSELIYYNLKEMTSKIISKTNNVNEELIYDCAIYGNYVIWSKFIEQNTNSEYRMSNYKYSDLYLYKIDSEKIEQLTKNEFYCNPSLFKEKLTMIKIPLTKENQVSTNTEIALMDITEKSIKIIVDENSASYKQIENQLYRSDPTINSKYISWYNSGFNNMFVYDYNRKEFVRIYDDKNTDKSNNTSIYQMYDDAVLIYESKKDGNNKKIFVRIP